VFEQLLPDIPFEGLEVSMRLVVPSQLPVALDDVTEVDQRLQPHPLLSAMLEQLQQPHQKRNWIALHIEKGLIGDTALLGGSGGTVEGEEGVGDGLGVDLLLLHAHKRNISHGLPLPHDHHGCPQSFNLFSPRRCSSKFTLSVSSTALFFILGPWARWEAFRRYRSNPTRHCSCCCVSLHLR
jgi:hypothetical protein